jgi:hypothetical protein
MALRRGAARLAAASSPAQPAAMIVFHGSFGACRED